MNLIKILFLLSIFLTSCSILKNSNEVISIVFTDKEGKVLKDLNVAEILHFYEKNGRIKSIELDKKTFFSIREIEKKVKHLIIVKDSNEVYKAKWRQPNANIESMSQGSFHYSEKDNRIIMLLITCGKNNMPTYKRNCVVNNNLNKELIEDLIRLNKISDDSFDLDEFKFVPSWIEKLPNGLSVQQY